MKVFVNKYPLVGNCIYPSPDGELPERALDKSIAIGKVWEIIGVSQMDVIVAHNNFHMVVNSEIFKLTFTEIDLPV